MPQCSQPQLYLHSHEQLMGAIICKSVTENCSDVMFIIIGCFTWIAVACLTGCHFGKISGRDGGNAFCHEKDRVYEKTDDESCHPPIRSTSPLATHPRFFAQLKRIVFGRYNGMSYEGFLRSASA